MSSDPANSARRAAEKRKLLLERFAPYRLVALGHTVSRRLAKTYAGDNLTIPEWRVLAVVAQAERVAARDGRQAHPYGQDESQPRGRQS